MTVDGIWTGEILGPYGWENSGVYVLEQGRILGGSNRHYSNGRYTVTDGTYHAKVQVHYYGPPRAIFGEKRERFVLEVTGKLEDDVMEGHIVPADKLDSTVSYRMSKRLDLPDEHASP